MTRPKSANELSERIEEIVRAYVIEGRNAAEQALRRGFSGTQPTEARPAVAAAKRLGGRRSSGAIVELRERLCQLVIEKPGSSIVIFAEALNESPRSLHRPMAMLKESRRVRSIGERQFTRYYPRPTVDD